MPYQGTRAKSLPIAAATVIARNRLVTIDANGQLAYPGAGLHAVGVAGEASAVGDDRPLPVALLDGALVEVEAGAAIVAGANLAADADGQVLTAAAGNTIVGIALTAAAAVGEIITMDTTQRSAAQG